MQISNGVKRQLTFILIIFCLAACFCLFCSDRVYAASSRKTGTNESVSTYGGATRQYTSLATWEAATDVDLVTGTISYVLECYDDATSFNDYVDLSGATTNASYFRIIRPAAGQGHDGTPNNGVTFVSTTDAIMFAITENYSQVQDIIAQLNINSANSRVTGSLLADYTAFIGCIVVNSVNNGTGSATGLNINVAADYGAIVDCLVHNVENVNFNIAAPNSIMYNCTATNAIAGGGFRLANGAGTTIYVTNCLGSSNTGGDFTKPGAGTATVTYSASADATADDWGGAGNRISQTFTFVNSAGDDFHLASTDAGALNYGTDLSSNATYPFNDDINDGTMGAGKAGQTRAGTWDMGFDEAGFTIAGTVYTNEGSTNIGANKTAVLKVNGANACGVACTAETDANGAYSTSSVVFALSDVITVFLDGETEKAVTVTRAPNPAANITGLDLYQNRLIVRHEDAGPTTNADLGQYDKDNDADIHFTVDAFNYLTVDNDTELHIWTGKTFSPGTNLIITTSAGGVSPYGDIHLDDNSILTATGASAGITCGGSWTADSGATFTSSAYVTFSSTLTGKTITPGASSFPAINFNGSGGWTFQANATTTDNFTITAGTVTGPSSGHLAVAGNWANNGGTFTPNSSEVKFNATATGKALSSSGSGNLTFYDVDFNGSGGIWTVQNNATSTNNWKLTAGGFTLSPNIHLEVNGSFTNITSGTTTWGSGSILFLNSGTAYTVNTKTAGADTYNTLEIGANTDIRLWNSNTTGAFTVNSSGSLYSMDHSGSDGSLDIKGDYHVPASSTDYWNYATDFDGTAGANRAVTVLIADSSTVNVDSGTTLQIIGTNTATTTISRWISGSYGLTVNNGTLNAQYYKFLYLNDTGLNLSGASATITNLANGEFDNSAGSGASDTFITVAGDVITNNAAKTFAKCHFDDTNGLAEYNVTATGSTASYWTFSTSYGTFDGESYDLDPGGDPGYIRWDDSTSGTLSETASSSATFSSVTYSFSSQNDTGNLMGAVTVSDSRGAAPGWDLNVTSADWSRTGGGSMDYDGDGILTGQLCLVLTGASIYATSGSMTGVTKGSDACFDWAYAQLQIADATVGNGVGTYWLVDQTMSQFIPAMQQAGTYTTTLSIVAS